MGEKTGRIMAVFSLFILFCAIAVYFFLSGHDVGTSLFKKSMEAAVTSLPGLAVISGSVSGNPVTGYDAENVHLRLGERDVATVKRLTVRLSLRSLARGEVRVRRVILRGAAFQSSDFLSLFSRESRFRSISFPDAENIPSLVILGSSAKTPQGELFVESFRTSPGKKDFSVLGRGTFRSVPLELEARVALGEVLSVREGVLKAGNAAFTLEGSIVPLLSLKGNMKNGDLETIAGLAGIAGYSEGAVSTSFSLEMSGGFPLLSGEGTVREGKVWGLPLEGGFSWSLGEGKATLKPRGGTIFSAPAEGIVSFTLGQKTEAEIRIQAKKTDLKALAGRFPWLSFARGVLASLAVDLKGPLGRLSGSITFSAADSVLQGFPVSDLKGTISLPGGTAFLLDASGNWLGSPVTASGTVIGGNTSGDPSRISLRSVSLNLKKAGDFLFAKLGLAGQGRGEVSLLLPRDGIPRIEGKITASKASILGVAGEDLAASFKGTTRELDLSSLTFSLSGGGVLSGKGSLSGLEGKTPLLSLEGTGKGIPGNFFQYIAFGGKLTGTGGRMEAGWWVKGPLSSPAMEFLLKGGEAPLLDILPLRNARARVRLERGELSLAEGAASLFGGKIVFEGKCSLPSSSLSVSGSFSSLAVKDLLSLAEGFSGSGNGFLSGGFSLSGKTSSPLLSVSVASPELSVGNLPVTGLRIKADGTLSSLRISEFQGRLFKVPLAAKGEVPLSKGGKADLRISAKNMEIRPLAAAFLPGVSLGGNADLDLFLAGRVGENLSPVFAASIPMLSLQGVLLENVKATVKPGKENDYALSLEGLLGESILDVAGKASFTPGGVRISLSNRKRIDLGKTAAALSASSAGIVAGTADFTMKGLMGTETYSWEGRITSPSLGIYRTEAKEVAIPFAWTKKGISVTGGSARWHGGRAGLDGTLDPFKGRWEGTFSVKEFDLGSATSRLLGKRGTISGTADLSLRGNGTGGAVGMVFGSGQLSARNGKLSGFQSLKSVSSRGEVNFSSVLASFNVDGRNIFLLPGSRVSAPVGDEVYRYFSASGSIGWNNSPLDLKCLGDINVRALNAFLGALQGFISVDGNPLTDPLFLQRFLSGLLGGYSSRDFQETTFNLKGTWEHPLISDLKVPGKASSVVIPDGSGPVKKNEPEIKITVEIPTGEGKDTSPGTEEQMKKQILENLMRTIIRPGGSGDGGTSD